MLKDAVNRYSISGQQHRMAVADRFFRAAQWQALDPAWYGPNKVETDFKPQHAMLSMHVWFIHRRLLAANDDGKGESGNFNLMIQEELFDIFWNDTKSRIRAAGVHELTVNKHLKDAQQATFLHCTQFDHAFNDSGDDKLQRFEIICDAVWKHILGGMDDVDEDLIRRLGAYVEYQLDNVVFKLPDAYFEEGRIGWGNVPDLSKFDTETNDDANKDGNEGNKTKFLSGLKFLDNDWVQVLTDAGTPYYWNTSSQRVQWQKPE